MTKHWREYVFECSRQVEERDLDEYRVTYQHLQGRPPKLSGKPEDCYEGEPDEIDITKIEFKAIFAGVAGWADINNGLYPTSEFNKIADWLLDNKYEEMCDHARTCFERRLSKYER